MATINLRLSPVLEDRARLHASELGISINALMSVAVDRYFRGLNPSPPTLTGGESAINEVIRPQIDTIARAFRPVKNPGPPGANATKKERQAWTAFQRSQGKLPLDGVPG